MRLKRNHSARVMGCFMTALFVATLFSPFALGETQKRELPPRDISVSPEYTGVAVPEGDPVSIDLVVSNKGKNDENIDLQVTLVPDGWKAWIKTYDFGVTGVHVKSDTQKNLTLRAEPGKDVAPGSYTFVIQGQTVDRQLTATGKVVITVEEKKEKKRPEGVNIVTSYPVLTGPTDAKFEFSVEVENKSDKEGIFNLSAQAPENWTVNFKPAYEDKFISSLRLKAGQSQTMAVELTPNPWAEPGEYPVGVKISSPEAEGQVALTVILTGTFKLDAGTANALLSLSAVRGEASLLSFYVKNTGSAPLNNVRFISFQPENWKVSFAPESIDTLAPQEFKQVEVSITPAAQALVGDYSVGLRAESGSPPKADKTIEMRVSVTASAAWGWIGIGLIVFVMAGLVFLFTRLGRR
ncbi:MAG: NEW3 domain-containing protein [Candidatus Desulfacyla sp.]